MIKNLNLIIDTYFSIIYKENNEDVRTTKICKELNLAYLIEPVSTDTLKFEQYCKSLRATVFNSIPRNIKKAKWEKPSFLQKHKI